MAKFENTPHKIRTTFEKIQKNRDEIEKKENELFKIFQSKNYIKHNNLLFDSGWIAKITDENAPVSSDSHTEIGTLIPLEFYHNFLGEMDVPREMLPFLEIESRVKTPPNTTLASQAVYTSDMWDSNFYEVRGDGELIWQGILPPSFVRDLVSQDEIDQGKILESHTKQAWIADIYWTDANAGFDYRILNAHIVAWSSIHMDVGVGCDSNENYTIYIGAQYWDSPLSLPAGTIVDISGRNMQLLTQKVVHTWTDPGGGCADSVVRTENFPKILNVDTDIDTLTVFGQRQRWNGSSWINNPVGSQYNVIVSSSPDITITTFTATEANGFYPYYDTGGRFLFFIFNSGTFPFDPTLGNLPTAGGTNQPATLPWTTINFKINPDPYPQRLSEREVVRANGDVYLRGEDPHISKGNSYRPVFFRISKSTDSQEKYVVNSSIEGNILAPALTIHSTSNYRFWDDDYTGVTTYTATSTDHQTKERSVYRPLDVDFQVKIRAMIRNPFYWKETRKFDKKES